MAGLCESGNEPPGFLKAIYKCELKTNGFYWNMKCNEGLTYRSAIFNDFKSTVDISQRISVNHRDSELQKTIYKYNEHTTDFKYNRNKSKFANHLIDEGHELTNIKDTLKIVKVINDSSLIDTSEQYYIVKTFNQDRRNDRAIIIDPTVRFETAVEQPVAVHEEKKTIYDPTIHYFRHYYHIQEHIEVFGLLFEQGEQFQNSQLNVLSLLEFL
ncbi:hypothetical protein ANN_23691 [Periplaneta americana]|uniref:Uncharacterized protein n=1 Tax=Periplaneta americana TaxID=6978 RepID=A0ABQ8SLS4_PERAM|nr:hypothetical protein ANN_23691 [Periplaneta americana]